MLPMIGEDEVWDWEHKAYSRPRQAKSSESIHSLRNPLDVLDWIAGIEKNDATSSNSWRMDESLDQSVRETSLLIDLYIQPGEKAL